MEDEQLQKLKEYFEGIITVDYYLDKHIVITIARQWYDTGIRKVGRSGFWAWDCFVVLLWVVEKQDVEIIHDIDDCESNILDGIVHGSRFYEESEEYSTFGARVLEGVVGLKKRDLRKIKQYGFCTDPAVGYINGCFSRVRYLFGSIN